jgi:myo-inositol-1(or 4)-monophosphatase
MTSSGVLDVLVAAAREGQRVARAARGRLPGSVRTKSSCADLVTEVDVRVQDAVAAFLARHAPGACVVGEEAPAPVPCPAERIYVDPIDGTLNFVHGLADHALSLGYWRADAPVAGVVLKLSTGEVFAAERGGGARRDGAVIRPSPRARPGEALVATGWPYDKSRAGAVLAEMRAVIAACQEIRVLGSAALAMCYVAAGVLDGYWETGLGAWDLAGGAVIALEAGATVTTPAGGPFALDRGAVLATNGPLHGPLTDLLAGAGEGKEARSTARRSSHHAPSGDASPRPTQLSSGGRA